MVLSLRICAAIVSVNFISSSIVRDHGRSGKEPLLMQLVCWRLQLESESKLHNKRCLEDDPSMNITPQQKQQTMAEIFIVFING